MIEDRGANKHLVRVYVGRDEKGKRTFSSIMVHGTISQAKQKERELKSKKDVGTLAPSSKQTVRQFLTAWLEGKTDLSTKSRTDYGDRLRTDVYPLLGSMRIEKVTSLAVQTLYGSLLSDRKLSGRTVQYTHSILRQALQRAVEWNILPKNPCDYVTAPKRAKSKMAILTPEHVSTLFASSRTSSFGAMWRLQLTAGMRIQELLALKWDDLSGRELQVRRSLVRNEDGQWTLSDTQKNASSSRSIMISSETVAVLASHRISQATCVLKNGSKYERNGLIFCTTLGRPFDIANVRKAWKAALANAKVPLVRLYDTRHTHISHLLASGANVKAVAERAGHANPNMTLSVYAHTLPGADALLADAQETLYALRTAEGTR